jgi:hypothetical protein
MDIKKKEFIAYFKQRLHGIDVDANLQDTALLLCQASEDHIHKDGKKLGHIRKECVMEVLRAVIKKPLDEKQLSGLVDSIVLNFDIHRTPIWKRLYKMAKAWAFQPAAERHNLSNP